MDHRRGRSDQNVNVYRWFFRSTAWTPRLQPISPAKPSTLWPLGCASTSHTRRQNLPDTMSSTLQVCGADDVTCTGCVCDMTCQLIFIFVHTGSKAVDSLLESKWATSEKLFTTRQEIETFLDLYDICSHYSVNVILCT